MYNQEVNLDRHGETIVLSKLIHCPSGAFPRSVSFPLEAAREVIRAMRDCLDDTPRVCFGTYGVTRLEHGLEVYDGNLLSVVLSPEEARAVMERWDVMFRSLSVTRRIRIFHLCRDCGREEPHEAATEA